ncbi:MAG: LysM peptidoglycan-binding domain-containing protein [Gemmatimonadaceae bacterium]
MFFDGSRYGRVTDVTFTDGDGRAAPLKASREPATVDLALIYQVRAGDRLDALAFKFYRDARKWWLIADANTDVLALEQLLEPGRMLRIPKDRNP